MFDVKNNTAAARNFWSSHDLRQKKIMAFFMPKIAQIIQRQLKAVIKASREQGIDYVRVNMFTLVDLPPIVAVLRKMYLKSAYIESNYVLGYLLRGRKSVPANMEQKRTRPSPASFGLSLDDLAGTIDDYFKIRVINDSALPINETTRRYIVANLLAKVDAGMSADDAITGFQEIAITKSKNPYAMMRARRIAMSETTKVLSFGGLIGAYMSGLDVEKVWVTSYDERVRGLPNYVAPYSHVALDGVSEALMGNFYNRENIKFPGDPQADKKNTAGCRCCLYYRERPKPKPPRRAKPKIPPRPRLERLPDEPTPEPGQQPRPRRNLQQFLVDFLAGTLIGTFISDLINGE